MGHHRITRQTILMTITLIAFQTMRIWRDVHGFSNIVRQTYSWWFQLTVRFVVLAETRNQSMIFHCRWIVGELLVQKFMIISLKTSMYNTCFSFLLPTCSMNVAWIHAHPHFNHPNIGNILQWFIPAFSGILGYASQQSWVLHNAHQPIYKWWYSKNNSIGGI